MAGNQSVRVQADESSNPDKREINSRAHVETSAFVTRTGLLLPKRIAFAKWVGIGNYLSNVISASTWCLGDWLVYGEASFNGRYRDAIELTSLDYQTLRNHAWVARRFPISRRRDALSFTHHAEVASLSEPEQDFWLRNAEEYGWSAKRLRREVKASLQERAVGNGRDPGERSDVRDPQKGREVEESAASAPGGTVSLRVLVPADRLEFCRATASRLGLNIETWAAQILLEAVGRAPDELLWQELTAVGGPVRAMQKTV
ncbi:LmbU family transcriptional regulator [Streptomyces albipurpureus]|uniref:LmbU family transcriptional regulator n=1 Tax=Streptomyces albipurpureus TaxID=2897419 RepID=A0ABT0UHG4_9ACTN|nr:LmbU family transcriptional regulator [Streptomyces sp. CWNU-1]MCM2387662.1 LmbU family transcriptional regulator [Streptomyces sp. CWNU-1]